MHTLNQRIQRALRNARSGSPTILMLHRNDDVMAIKDALGRNAMTVYGKDPLARLPNHPTERYVIMALPGEPQILFDRYAKGKRR